jgi:hypothetical protein
LTFITYPSRRPWYYEQNNIAKIFEKIKNIEKLANLKAIL